MNLIDDSLERAISAEVFILNKVSQLSFRYAVLFDIIDQI